jgi:hypothetical protein
MPATAWTIFNSAKEFIGDGTIDLDTDTFKLALFTTGYVPTATQQAFAAIATDEISHSSYTDNGETLAGVAWTRTAGQVKFDANDVAITATSGSLSAKYAVIYDDSTATAGDPVTDALVCYSNLSSTGGSVSVSEANTLTIKFATTDGIFTVS